MNPKGVAMDEKSQAQSINPGTGGSSAGVSAQSLHKKHQESRTNYPLISVIVPVYNCAKILERCVNSILNQTYPKLEIILIDDGSTDMSGKFCDIFAKKDSHIKVIHQANQGQSVARNAGLDLASGDYITFVDCDDRIESTLTEELYQLIIRYHVRLAIGSFVEVLPTGERKPFTTDEQPKTTVLSTEECLIDMLLEQNFAMAVWGKLYARELFDSVRFPAGKIYEDVATTYRLILQCPEIALTTSTKYEYYHNNNSTTRQSFHRRKLALIELTDEMCDEIWQKLGQNGDEEAQRRLLHVLDKRRMQSRFGVLRQMVMLNPHKVNFDSVGMTKREFRRARRAVVKYLRRHKNDILENPYSSRRDLLAMRALLFGLPAFKFAWKIYSKQNQ